MMVSVLVDNDALQARLIVDNLSTIGHTVLPTVRPWDGLVIANEVRPDLIIIDCDVPQSLELLTLIPVMRTLSRTPVLLLATQNPPRSHIRKLAIANWIIKPLDAELLVQEAAAMSRQIAGRRMYNRDRDLADVKEWMRQRGMDVSR